MEDKEYYAVFIAKIGDYERDFGHGNKIELKNKVARRVSEEVASILKDAHNVVVFHGIDEKIIEFRPVKVKKEYKDLVKEHGVQKAKQEYDKQQEESHE